VFFLLQACKGEDLGKVEFEEEIKKRFKMVYVPNWFSVDLKTGVSHTPRRTRARHLSSCYFDKLSASSAWLVVFLSPVSGLPQPG